MKRIIFTAIILFSFLGFKFADAQVSVSVGVNIGMQPAWGPVGYSNASYYYIPDVGAYYDVNAHQYIYLQNNVWVHEGYLPARYRSYDLYHGYKAVINERNPWERDGEYRGKYAGYRGRRDQPFIRDSRDERYRQHWHGDDGRHNGFGHRDNGNERGRKQYERPHGHGERGRDQGERGQDHGQRGHDHGGRGHDEGHGGQDGHRGH